MTTVIHPDFAKAIAEQWLAERDEVAITRERLAELEADSARVATLDQQLQHRDQLIEAACPCTPDAPRHDHLTGGYAPDWVATAPDWQADQRHIAAKLAEITTPSEHDQLAELKANDPFELSPESQAAIRRTVNRNDAAGEPYGAWPCTPEGS